MEAPITLTTHQQQIAASTTSTIAQPDQQERQAALEVVLGAMQKLLDDGQSHAFQIGKYVNRVDDERLAVDAGYRSAKSCFIQKLKGIDARNVSTLYKYATVARSFSEADARELGIFKLNALTSYQMAVHTQVLNQDPGNYEVALLQEDGTMVMKKFRDCSVSDLRADLKRRKHLKQETTRKTALATIEPQPSAKLALGASTSQGPVAKVAAANKVPPPTVKRVGKLLGLGIVVATVGEILRHTMVGAWIAWLGCAIFMWGIGMLVREWVKMHGQWMSALEHAFQPVLRGLEELKSPTLNPGNHPTSTSQVSEEFPTTPTKKAA